jgi:hypothetical protein
MQITIAIPRPAADEHHEYYGAYIAKAPGDDLFEALRLTADSLLALVDGVGDSQALHRYAPGKWSVKEVLNHVVDSERVFGYRALAFAREDRAPLPGFDETAWTPAARSDRRPLAAIAGEFRAVRDATGWLFGSFDPDALVRRGEASECVFTVRALGWSIAGHTRHHETILRERYGLGG